MAVGEFLKFRRELGEVECAGRTNFKFADFHSAPISERDAPNVIRGTSERVLVGVAPLALVRFNSKTGEVPSSSDPTVRKNRILASGYKKEFGSEFQSLSLASAVGG